MSGLESPLQIADELYCVLHDDRDGTLQVDRHIAQIGLAAGLLAELMCEERVGVVNGRVVVTSLDPPEDALAHSVLDQIASQGTHRDLPTWLAFLATGSLQRVLNRLVSHGAWRYEERRAILRRKTVCVPKEMIFTSGRVALLANTLTSRDPIRTPTAVLLGLIDATNMFDRVNWQRQLQAYGSRRLRRAVDSLPAEHRMLLDCVRAEVGSAVLAPR